MAENKKSFLLYCDLINTVKKLPPEKQGELFMTILEYVNDLNPEITDLSVDLVFEPVKLQLKRDLTKYEDIKDKKSISGREGNLKRWHLDVYNIYMSTELTLEDAEDMAKNRKTSQPDKLQSQNIANIAVTDTVTVTDNDIDNVSVSKEKFTPKQFLSWFNDSRTKLLEKPSNSNYLSSIDKTHLEILTSRYEGKDFGKALHNLCNDKWANESSQIIPKHFLKPENFDKYLQIESKTLITKKQKINRGWSI